MDYYDLFDSDLKKTTNQETILSSSSTDILTFGKFSCAVTVEEKNWIIISGGIVDGM